jgi:hypothetical protein
MFLDTVTGFRVRTKSQTHEKNGSVYKMWVEFTCNYCDEILPPVELLGTEIRHPDTYSGLEGYLQLHWMGCEKYREKKK